MEELLAESHGALVFSPNVGLGLGFLLQGQDFSQDFSVSRGALEVGWNLSSSSSSTNW